MNTSRYIVTVSGRDGGRDTKFTVDTSDAQERDYYGETAQSIASVAAGDYCDSGTVVVNRSDLGERAIVVRR